MSKIGQLNIAMTERVNELGYETVEEAIADGWDSAEFYASYGKQAENEQAKAHEAWLKRKDAVTEDLRNLLLGMHAAGKSDTTDYNIISNAIEFIGECKSE